MSFFSHHTVETDWFVFIKIVRKSDLRDARRLWLAPLCRIVHLSHLSFVPLCVCTNAKANSQLNTIKWVCENDDATKKGSLLHQESKCAMTLSLVHSIFFTIFLFFLLRVVFMPYFSFWIRYCVFVSTVTVHCTECGTLECNWQQISFESINK